MIKNRLIALLRHEITSKIEMLTVDIKSLVESKNNDTKSSAGDKYETSREMAQIELNKLEIQLQKSNVLLNELNKIEKIKSSKTIEIGSLVISSQENYFLSVPFGKLILEHNEYYAISLASPMGIALKNKKIGDIVEFGGRKIEIKEIL